MFISFPKIIKSCMTRRRRTCNAADQINTTTPPTCAVTVSCSTYQPTVAWPVAATTRPITTTRTAAAADRCCLWWAPRCTAA